MAQCDVPRLDGRQVVAGGSVSTLLQDTPHDLDLSGREGKHLSMSIGSNNTLVNAMMQFQASTNVELAGVAAALLVLLAASDGTPKSIRTPRNLQASSLAASHLIINFRCVLTRFVLALRGSRK